MKFVELSGLLRRISSSESTLSAAHQFTAKDSSDEKIINDARFDFDDRRLRLCATIVANGLCRRSEAFDDRRTHTRGGSLR
jgi:hypothetical protein